MHRRVFPQPLISVTLLAIWMLAHTEHTFGLFLVGGVLALVIPYFTQSFWPEYPRTVRYRPLFRLVLVVLFDIIVANISVARLILGRKSRLKPTFTAIPLELRTPYAITLLGSIISLTPGTVSSNLSGDRRTLLIHALHVTDEDVSVAHIKQRYERPLLEIFE